MVEQSPQITHGPPVWICGDCHVGKFGPSPTPRVVLQLRTLNRIVIGGK
jgi:uncharacterized protein (DUF2252 family)